LTHSTMLQLWEAGASRSRVPKNGSFFTRASTSSIIPPFRVQQVMVAPLIEFKNVSKHFNGQIVLDRVDLEIYEGEITALIDKSGTGKTVLVEHLDGLMTPDEDAILNGHFSFEFFRVVSLAEGTGGGKDIDPVFKKALGRHQEIARVHCGKGVAQDEEIPS
jgi:ABC-type glutathione transport system ATPase component